MLDLLLSLFLAAAAFSAAAALIWAIEENKKINKENDYE